MVDSGKTSDQLPRPVGSSVVSAAIQRSLAFSPDETVAATGMDLEAALTDDKRMSDSINDIQYDAKFSISYHRKRESFYRILDASSKAVSLIALASIGFDASMFTMAAAIVSGIFTIATIVVDCPGMASKHGSLANRFNAILSRAVLVDGDGDGEETRRLRHEFHVIEADEPPQLRGLAQLCQDEQDAAEGKDVKPECLSMRRRVLAQFGFGQRAIDFCPPGGSAA